MSSTVRPQIVSADELLELSSDGRRYELIAGNLNMMSPAGGQHGRLANQLAWLLSNHVNANDLGAVFAAETGFRITSEPDTVLAPDVAFVSRLRFSGYEQEAGYLPFAPDLAIEVLSPSDRFSRVEAKSLAWLDADCRLVLLVDPENECVHAYYSRQQIQIYQKHETIDCSDAVAGWSLSLAQVFQR